MCICNDKYLKCYTDVALIYDSVYAGVHDLPLLFYFILYYTHDKYLECYIGFIILRAQEVTEYIKRRDTKYKTKVKQSWLASDLII